MNSSKNSEDHIFLDDELNLKDLLMIFWERKITILLTVTVSSIASIFLALSLPNKYTSTVLLAPVEQPVSSSNLSQYSSLANMAGISIPNTNSESDIGYEILKSKQFIKSFIDSRDILVPLIASKEWDWTSKELKINEKIYNLKEEKWIRKVQFPQTQKPSLSEAYDFWQKKVFSSKVDTKTGFISYSIEHHSPFYASQWANWLIDDLNNDIRNKDVQEAELAIEYLNEEAKKTNSEELKNIFYRLIQVNTEKKMLAFSREEYLYKVIDPASVSEKKSWPPRLLICIAGFFLGLISSISFALVRSLWKKENIKIK